MTKVRKGADCGNSPKNTLVQELTIAMACANTNRIRDLVSNDVYWLAVGRKPVQGIDGFCKALTRYGPVSEIAINHVLSHGRSGAIDGTVFVGGKRRAFCHMYEFVNAKGAKVQSMTT